jgi:hypothetical protein
MKYSNKSPYYETPLSDSGKYLDQLVTRNVPAATTDPLFEISQKYHLRPDLLAFDLYGDSRLWWVFAERNPNVLKDPVGDFVFGTVISLPDANQLSKSLG